VFFDCGRVDGDALKRRRGCLLTERVDDAP